MRLKKNKKNKCKNINIRCTEEDFNKIKRKANIYTEGNISELVLFAVLDFVPNKDDFEKEKAP